MNNKFGFALSEVLFALMIISVSLTALIILSGSLMRSGNRSYHLFEQQEALKSVLAQAHQERWFMHGKKRTEFRHDQRMKITYEPQAVPEQSVFARFKDHLMLERLSVEEADMPLTQQLVALIFKEAQA